MGLCGLACSGTPLAIAALDTRSAAARAVARKETKRMTTLSKRQSNGSTVTPFGRKLLTYLMKA